MRKQYLALLQGSIGVLVLGFANSVITSRLLGPAGRGDFLAWSLWAALFGLIAVVGVPQAIVLSNLSKPVPNLLSLRGLTASSLAFGSTTAVVAFAAAGVPPSVIIGGLAAAVTYSLTAISASVLQGTMQLRHRYNVVRLAPMVAQTCVVVGFLATSNVSAATLFLACGISMLGTALLVAPWGLGHRSRAQRSKDVARSAVHHSPITLLSYLKTNVDQLVVSAIAPPVVLAFYGVGVAMRSIVVGLANVISVRALAEGSRATSLRGPLFTTLGLGACVALPLELLAGSLIPLIWGSAFEPAVAAGRVLILAGVVMSVDATLAAIMTRRGQVSAVALVHGFFVVLTAGAVASVGKSSALTAAFCVLAISSITVCLMILAAQRKIKAHDDEDCSQSD